MFLKPLDNAAFKNPIGQKIQQAVNKDIATTNWALNLEICDDINTAKDGPQASVSAIRAAFQPRNDRQTENTLVLLDTLIKNCGRRFHLLVATRDFMCDLIRLVSPRDSTSQEVKDRALLMIERCSDAFKHDKDLAAVAEAYQYLKSQNVQFPAQNLDDMVSIHTPRASHSVIDPPIPHRQQNPATGDAVASGVVSGVSTPAPVPATVYTQPAQSEYHPSGISHTDLTRINKELLVVRGNDTVLNDILADLLGNNNPDSGDLQLLRDLHNTCKEMYKRMVELLEQVMEETLVCQLLDLIDKLNNTFLRYDRYERHLSSHGTPLSQPVPQPQPQPASQGQATNIYAASTSKERTSPAVPSTGTWGSGTGRSSDIEELLSLDVPAVPAANVNPFQEYLDAPISRLPPLNPGEEEQENIYTTAPAKIPNPAIGLEDVDLLPSQTHDLDLNDEFDMFAQSRSSTLNERVQVASSEEAYNAAHDVPQAGSLAGALNSRGGSNKSGKTNDDWLKEFDNIEPSTTAMTNEELDRFLDERAPAPPTTALNTERQQPGNPKKSEDTDLFAL